MSIIIIIVGKLVMKKDNVFWKEDSWIFIEVYNCWNCGIIVRFNIIIIVIKIEISIKGYCSVFNNCCFDFLFIFI